MNAAPTSVIHLDARLSPALEVLPDLLTAHRRPHSWLDRSTGRRLDCKSAAARPLHYDEALRWLMVSDRLVSDQAARALLEVKERRRHIKEGHARWATYLRAFVPMTARWCQQEMKRLRALRELPAVAAAWAAGAIDKSHLRILLRVVTPDTQDAWLQRASGSTVRELVELAHRESDRPTTSGPSSGQHNAVTECRDGVATNAVVDTVESEEEASRPRRRVVMAPPDIAVLVAEAAELARKMAGYQVGLGAAVEMMAMETLAGLNESSLPSESPAAQETPTESVQDATSDSQVTPPDCNASRDNAPRSTISLGDHLDLRREMGAGWEHVHRLMEESSGRWSNLPNDLREVLINGAPADDADAHERVVFWTGLQGRLDAVRGRLLRVVDERLFALSLGFAGFGQYVRERMGLSLREANELVSLDKALDRLPVAFRIYASGRLGRRAAWLISRIADRATDRAWTHFAMTHTLRLLEAVVEAAILKKEANLQEWEHDGRLPPQDATFAEALRACSFFKGVVTGNDATARIEFLLDDEQRACYEATLARLRPVIGPDRPEWWGLAVMARHFLNCHGDEDRLSSSARLRRMFHRRVIERDNYTCRAPECLQRGGLEADHMKLRSLGGPTTMENMVSLCAADHRFMKHQAMTLALSGMAPDRIKATVGARTYFNDRLVEPALDEAVLDEDPWAARTATEVGGLEKTTVAAVH